MIVAAALAVCAMSAEAGAQIVPNPQEGLYVALPRCRAFAVRLTGGQTRQLGVIETSTVTEQGGNPNGCAVPGSATAVSISLTAYNGGSPGFITAFPAVFTRPNSQTLTFQTTVKTTVETVVATGLYGRISIYTNQPISVIGDITGYYVPQISATVNAGGGILTKTTRIIGSGRPATGTYRVDFDRGGDGCIAMVQPEAGFTASTDWLGSAYLVYMRNTAGALANGRFSILVTC